MDDAQLPEVSLSVTANRLVLGRTTSALVLSGDSRGLRISDLLIQISNDRPMALLLPTGSREESLHKVICDVCSAAGIAVVLLPD